MSEVPLSRLKQELEQFEQRAKETDNQDYLAKLEKCIAKKKRQIASHKDTQQQEKKPQKKKQKKGK